MFESFEDVPLITVLFSALTALYMFMFQNVLYYEILPEPSFKNLIMAYFMWFIMAFSLKMFIIDTDEFDIIDVLTRGPLLGFVIYLAINITLYSVMPDVWTASLMSADILWGMALFSIVTFIIYTFKEFGWMS